MSVRGLPDSPDSPLYAEWLEEIEHAPTPQEALVLFRMRAEMDLWFYLWRASSLRNYRINEPGHPNKGRLWIQESFLFDRSREIQDDLERRVRNPLYLWGRFMFKTWLITVHTTCWETAADSTMTTGIATWKVDQVGHRMYLAVKKELESNPVLLKHWPDVLWQPGEMPDLWTKTALNVKRPEGIGDPTVSIHGLDSLPTSYHVRRWVCDDAVVDKNSRTGNQVTTAKESIQSLVLLGADDTLFRFAATTYAENDANMQLIEGVDGVPFYSKISFHPGIIGLDDADRMSKATILKHGKPVLHSAEAWKEKIDGLTLRQVGCQILLKPVGRGETEFELEWLNRSEYIRKPTEMRAGMNVYIIIDQAGEGERSDHFVIRVVGLGHDRDYYALDLWRERGLKVGEFFMLLMGPEEGETPPSWMPAAWREGLVNKWEPRLVYMEEYSTGLLGALQQEQKRRGFHFRLRRLPTIRRPKEERIELLSVPYERGRFHYPASGFGHGSKHAKEDDTYKAYRREEVGCWVKDPDANPYDGGLDSEAWLVQPETKRLFIFPRRITQHGAAQPQTVGELLKHHRDQQELLTPPSGWAA